MKYLVLGGSFTQSTSSFPSTPSQSRRRKANAQEVRTRRHVQIVQTTEVGVVAGRGSTNETKTFY